jgi:hypothetical protein
MPTRKVLLIYPEQLIKEPVIYRLSKEFSLIPIIRKARVTDAVGEVVLELSGSEEELERGIKYLTKLGVRVEPA